MLKDIKEYPSGGAEGIIFSKKWNVNMKVCADSLERLELAEKCFNYFNELPQDVESRLKKYIFRYFSEYKKKFTEKEKSDFFDVNLDNILNYIDIYSLVIDEYTHSDVIEFHVEGSCSWEIEHGIEITISSGKILYVGPCEGYAPNSYGIKKLIDENNFFDESSSSNDNFADKE